MTISSQVRTAGPFSGTGVAGIAYPFLFKVFQASDLVVYQADATGAQTLLVLSSNYTVALNADQNVAPGGTVTLLVALPIGYTLTVSSNIPTTQPTSLPTGGPFFAQVVENALDRLTILQQQQGVFGNQSIRAPFPETLTVLPPAASRASRVLGFNSSGDAVVLIPTTGTAADVLTQLADTSDAAKGAASVGFNFQLNYAASTIGWAVKQNAINVMWYSAVAAAVAGGTDCITTLNAITLLASATGRGVYFPAATYKTSLPLKTYGNVALFGDGEGGSVISKTTNTVGSGTSRARGGAITDSYVNDAIIQVWHTDTAGATIYAQFVHIHDLTLQGSGNTYGIYAPRLNNSSLKNLCINNVVTGYLTYDAWMTTHERVTMQSHATGWRHADDGSGLGTGTSCTWTNCWNNFDNSVRAPAACWDLFGLTYSALIGCGGDNATRLDATTLYLYSFSTCRGITVLACAAESSAAGIITASSSRVTVINMRSSGMTGNAGWATIGGILNDASVLTFIGCDFGAYTAPGTIFNQIIQNGALQTEIDSVMPSGGAVFISYGGGSSRMVQSPSQTTVYDATGIRLVVPQLATVGYSASMTPNYSLGNEFVITATNNTPFTINAIGGSPGTGALATITIRNTSAGNTGAATWDAVFKLAAWAVIATLLSRSITFRYNGTNWVEISRTPVDVPN